MRRHAFLAFGLVAIAFAALPVAARRMTLARAAAATADLSQRRRANAATRSAAVRSIDLEGLKKLLRRDAKQPQLLLVNFWATWCEPCREEFPDLVQIDRDYKARGLRFITVSLDDPAEINTGVPQFLREMHAAMPAYLLNVPDPEPAIKWVDVTWGGQLPATFLYDAEGQIVFKHMGRINPEELRRAIATVTSDK